MESLWPCLALLPGLVVIGFAPEVIKGGAAFFAWRRHEEGAADAFTENFDDHFAGVSSDVQDGYGYGGSSDGEIELSIGRGNL